MSEPTSTPGVRGAVDLSGLDQSQPGGAPTGASAGAAGRRPQDNVVVEGTDATIGALMQATISVPAIMVVWSASQPSTADFVATMEQVVRSYGGRVQLITVDIDSNAALGRALQVTQIPMSVGLLQGQPVPLFVGPQPAAVIGQYVDELLKVAVANGVTGRVEVDESALPEPELPPLIAEAYEAIDRGDIVAARSAFERALAEDPQDKEAALGLAQLDLLQRTAGVDLAAARQAAADHPDDIDAQTLIADLDVLGGHLDDAFGRLVDVVRRTSGDDRDKARTHLIGLFDVLGNEDPRVKKGRTALMSALF